MVMAIWEDSPLNVFHGGFGKRPDEGGLVNLVMVRKKACKQNKKWDLFALLHPPQDDVTLFGVVEEGQWWSM